MMQKTSNEAGRQRELDTYRIVDTAPEDAYDDIVRLASMLCDTPMALVSLVDRDRQWFKAKVGLDMRAGPRDTAFCNHAIQAPDTLMEVPDATLDARFSENPLVTGEPEIRFYAGMPLVTPNGAAIGTVCVIDNRPRTLTDEQRGALASLARLTMNLLDGRQRERALQQAAMLAGIDLSGGDEAAMSAGASNDYAIAIFEVQDFADLVATKGEWICKKILHSVDGTLEDACRPGSDVINHATGSPEFVAVLQGADTAATVARMRERLSSLEQEFGICVLASTADSVGGASMMEVFQRADEALGVEKDRRSLKQAQQEEGVV